MIRYIICIPYVNYTIFMYLLHLHVMSCDPIYSYCVRVQQDGTTHTRPKFRYEGVWKWTKHMCMLLRMHVWAHLHVCRLNAASQYTRCHWSMMVVDHTKEAIDSLSGNGDMVCSLITGYFNPRSLLNNYGIWFHSDYLLSEYKARKGIQVPAGDNSDGE